MRAVLNDRHVATEAAEQLPELHADVAAAEHEQVIGDDAKFHDRGRVEVRHRSRPSSGGRVGRAPTLSTMVSAVISRCRHRLAGRP